MVSIKHFTTRVDEQNKYKVYSLDRENSGTFRLWVVEWVIKSKQDARGILLIWENYNNEEDALKAFDNHINNLE